MGLLLGICPLLVCARPSDDAREVAQGGAEHLSWARSCLGSSSVLPSKCADSRMSVSGWAVLCISWQKRPCPTHTLTLPTQLELPSSAVGGCVCHQDSIRYCDSLIYCSQQSHRWGQLNLFYR